METIYEIQRIRQVVMEETADKNIVRTPDDGAEIARKFIGDDDRVCRFDKTYRIRPTQVGQ